TCPLVPRAPRPEPAAGLPVPREPARAVAAVRPELEVAEAEEVRAVGRGHRARPPGPQVAAAVWPVGGRRAEVPRPAAGRDLAVEQDLVAALVRAALADLAARPAAGEAGSAVARGTLAVLARVGDPAAE